jgi:hypothetical protein
MAEDRDENAKDAARKAREERLAAALRANLRRRKAAGREPPGSAADTTASPSADRRGQDD